MRALQVLWVMTLQMFCFGQDYNEDNTYDYIVVGAGSAGATVANRLSEDQSVQVLLIEAGPPPPKDSEFPLFIGKYTTNTAINWNYTMEPNDKSCHGANITNSCPYFMGRTLGGSSQINAMMYVRGNKVDYDRWEQVYGADGWSYEKVLPYFKKAEGLAIKNGVIEEEYHGKSGPLTVSLPNYKTVLADAFVQAFVELGYDQLDYNGKNQSGFAFDQMTQRNGYRCSTEKAYLEPAYNRSNLKIITSALVTKVIIESKVAKGVFYIKDGQTVRANARREVIISAGAIKSPQLLMLSGIGPKDQLIKFKIDVVVDLPGVGQNLQDHVASGAMKYVTEVEVPGVPTANDVTNYTSLSSYEFPENLTGPLAYASGFETTGFIKSQYESVEDPSYVDTHIVIVSSLAIQSYYSDELKEYLGQYSDVPAFTLLHTVLHPESFGNISLRSSDPSDSPLLYFNYFSDPHDMKVLINTMKIIKEAVKKEAFAKYKPKRIGPYPGCEKFDMDSDDYLDCIARLFTVSVYHGCGTCKMGQINDNTTVVDSLLRVKGISGLRVVDTSVMPRIVSANTNAPVIMIAEKAADMIKEAWQKKGGGYEASSSENTNYRK